MCRHRHFNIADLVLLKDIFEAARELNVPVIVGASEGEREFAGTRLSCEVCVRSLTFPSALNADHTHSLVKTVEAVDAAFDSVVFDLSTLPLEENTRSTRHAAEALKSMNPAVVAEGEVGDIGSGSEIHADGTGADRALMTPEEARQFVTVVTGTERKHLAIERIREIKIRDRYTAYFAWRFRQAADS